MGTVTFLSPSLTDAVTVQFQDYERPTLLSLAQGHGIPLHGDCLSNGCGSCAVKVAAVRPSRMDTVSLSAAEKDTLRRAGRITPEQYRTEALTANTPLWRLACQVVPSGEDIWVAF